jgi:hypothetical protein
MSEGEIRKPFWTKPAFSVLLALLFLLASLWSAISYAFHMWLVAYRPEHPEPNATLALIYMVATLVFFLAIFIVPFLIRRKARSRLGGGTPAKR